MCQLTFRQVDNVAGLYAGVRDSVLTNHGAEQADKLGAHLAKTNSALTHIFSSPLMRTSKTSEAIRKAQGTAFPDTSAPPLTITKVPDLIEQVRGTNAAVDSILTQSRILATTKGNPSKLERRIPRRPDAKHTGRSTKTILASSMSKARIRWRSEPTAS